MRQNITQKILALMIILLLFSGFVWTNRALAWTATILAEGKDLGDVTENSVEIGVEPVAEPIPAPPFPPPQYSVKMDLYTSDLTELLTVDIREEGDIQHTWIIGVDPHGNVGSSVVPATATLSWDSSQFGPGTYQLQAGYDGTGAIVVGDMRNTTSYAVTGLAIPQLFTIIFTEIDNDEDDVPDRLDNCPNVFNPNQEDGDGDGAGDACDDCPDDSSKTEPGACGCGALETDSDSDGTPDCIDNCSEDPNKTEPGACGCGALETDSDSDGTPDCIDGCLNDPYKDNPGVCGCGISDIDSDSDGTPDCNDGCPNDPGKIAPGACGCGVADSDSDSDGTLDCNDGCPIDPDKTTPGLCGCGVADIDSDGDGTLDCNDGCPIDPDKTTPGLCGCGTSDTDSDGDGTPDCIDDCPIDPDKTDPGACGCGALETDSDNDGTPDCNDNCPDDPGKTVPGTCGCGVADTDSDNDGTPDCDDNCPNDPGKTEAGVCGCGVADTDSDGDGTLDCNDNCPDDPNKTEPGACGCGVADIDSDGDGTLDCNDNCPNDPGKTDLGTCGCGVADTDSDSDGTPDCNDNCPDDPSKTAPGTCGCGVADTDSDSDGTPNCNDNCPDDPGKTEAGVCGCGVADTDSDGDGTLDCQDGCPDAPNKTEPGECGCGEAETGDTDGDGVHDCNDNCSDDPNPGQEDFDEDGLGDTCDLDDDNDGIPDDTDTDDDNDGMPDEWEDEYGFNSVGDDALQDEDEDGFTNIQEYLAGTNPTDETSKPQGAMAHWYVDGAVDESGNGRTWSTAFKTIQEAIDSFEDGLNEIWVKQGDYVISSTIEVFDPVAIYAGFTGIETLRSQRDWQTNVAAVDGNDAVRCFSISADAILDGFTITNGSAKEEEDGSAEDEDENSGEGGGILNQNGASPTISNCTFVANSAEATGGAIRNDTSDATITNCIFVNNQVTREQESGGGGICNENSNPIITNCIFWGNHVDATQLSGGGAILNISSSPMITNCTIVGNSVAIGEDLADDVISGGGGILNIEEPDLNIGGSEPVITNCIIRENTALNEPQIYDIIGHPEYGSSESNVTYCNVEGGYEGDGNINADPRFVDPENGDFHLQGDSPCIDAGTNEGAPGVDLEGTPRPLDGDGDGIAITDMGSDEAFVSATGDNIAIGVLRGGTMTRCVFVDPAHPKYDAPKKPDRFFYGLIEMEIKNVDSGLAIVRISLPDLPPPPEEGYDDWKWYKYTPAGKWIDFNRDKVSGGTGDGAEINGTEVILYISDNDGSDKKGLYDDDPTPGVIKDPTGLGAIAIGLPSQPTGGGGGGGGGCFIATAAYGTPFEGHVMILRQFRNAYLLPTKIGHAFVDFYWKYSPPLADFIAKHDSLRAAVRIGLAPVVGMAYVALHTTTAQKVMLVIMMLGLLTGAYMKFRRLKWKRAR